MVQIDSSSPAPTGIELPISGQRRERADAAANRQRILRAARELLVERGVEGLTMQAVATAAGVGKGTVFHRFGDRNGLTYALLDDHMRDFQDAFLHGPPPLGPGAPPQERLEAFVIALIRHQADHIELALAAESAPGERLAPAYGALLIHIASLVEAIDPALDARIAAGFVLNAIAPSVLHRMRSALEVDSAALQDTALAVLRGLTHPTSKARPGATG